MNDLINISVGDAAMTALLGYAVVFIGIIMLMILVMFVGDLMFKSAKRKAAKAPAAAPAAPAAPAAAPGTAGELKLYDTDPRDAAMVMAIVADKLGKPLNELRFKSIREVKDK
ncbi:MAG: OadG family transporter subunit [Candidatus Limivicinus sp.]|uniref:OadG family transporter subunit n=1 Tax=Candidatus Limivicinus sp. TaxID=3030905 RepID=UPI002A8CDBA6|nr:OadG family transporter subunit [Candidatus Limivicinus sp.]MDY5083121.1 OadG family transporter subunit [Candidatus Limivicinus sp.]